MGACAGFAGPKRQYKQKKQLKYQSSVQFRTNNQTTKIKDTQNISISSIPHKHMQSNIAYSNYTPPRNEFIKIYDQNSNYKQFDYSSQLPRSLFRQSTKYNNDNENKKSLTLNFRRVQSEDVEQQGKSPYQNENIEYSPQTIFQIDNNSRIAYSNITSLPLKKKYQLQSIQQVINDEVKTPQYIREMRKEDEQIVSDAIIKFEGILPIFKYTPIYNYLSDLQLLTKPNKNQMK